MSETRRMSARRKAEEQPAEPSPAAKKPKVKKIYARRSTGNIKDGNSQTPSSQQSPAPFSKLSKDSPLPIQATGGSPPDAGSRLKSIAESGILAASLAQSRSKWITEGLFERYWSKPVKRKGQIIEMPKNPAKETMQKLGLCKITIEPHVLDATLFSIREWPPPLPQPVPQVQRPFTQYPPTPKPPFTPQNQVKPYTPGPQALPQPRPSAPTTWKPQAQQPPAPHATLPQPAPAQPKPSQDPVIQMLAQRASTSPELKMLMKIVASGNASKKQLEVFQGHIDDLTAIIQRQGPPPAPAAPPPQIHHQSPLTAGYQPPSHQQRGLARPSPQQPGLAFSQQPPPPNPPLPRKVGNELKGICIEFASSGSGDRLRLPRMSILEFSPGYRQVKASFLITRRGAGTPGLDSSRTYYQPVTVTLTADQPRVLEPLARATAPADEVRKHMTDTMLKSTRAPHADLALRLPVSGPIDDADDTGTPVSDRRTTARGHERANARKRDEDPACRYCFTHLPADAPKDRDGLLVCASCHVLKLKQLGSEGGMPLLTAQLEGAHVSGPRTLMFAAA